MLYRSCTSSILSGHGERFHSWICVSTETRPTIVFFSALRSRPSVPGKTSFPHSSALHSPPPLLELGTDQTKAIILCFVHCNDLCLELSDSRFSTSNPSGFLNHSFSAWTQFSSGFTVRYCTNSRQEWWYIRLLGSGKTSRSKAVKWQNYQTGASYTFL